MIKILIIMLLLLTARETGVEASSIEIRGERATAEYWTREGGERELLRESEIAKLNEEIRKRDEYSADLSKYPERVEARRIREKIERLWRNEGFSEVEGLYTERGKEIERKEYERVLRNRNIGVLSGEVKVRYAVTTERGNLRLLPERKGWYDNADFRKYDALQGTAIDPAEGVAVLSESLDGEYIFVQTRNYIGWLEKEKVGFTSREEWQRYVKPEEFLVVTAKKKRLREGGREWLFQMGSVIPLIEEKGREWRVRLPIGLNGQLSETSKQISRNDIEVNKGWLPCTSNNFIRQAFKFLGEEYDWGGMTESVDCSAYSSDVYRSMGVEIPRDANRQEGAMPIWAVFNDVDRETRWDIVRRAPVGSLLFKRGHVLIKLGQDEAGNPLVIHAASSYYDFSGGYGQKHYIRKVIVSDLHYQNGNGVETIDDLIGIGFIGRGYE